MTCSDIIIWFAEQYQHPILRRTIVAKLGNVRSQMEHLVQLGLLDCYYDFRSNDFQYSLKNWASYQATRAA